MKGELLESKLHPPEEANDGEDPDGSDSGQDDKMRDEGAEKFGSNLTLSSYLLATSEQSLALQVVFGSTGISSVFEHFH